MPAAHIHEQEAEEIRHGTTTRLNDHFEVVQREAHRADEARFRRQRVARERGRLSGRNSNLTEVPSHLETRHYIALLLLAAIYVIDFFLFGGVANSLARASFPNSGVWLYFIKLLTPAAFLIFELYLATLIYESRSAPRTGTAPRSGFSLWLLIGVVFSLAMPAWIVASHPDTLKFLNGGSNQSALSLSRLIGVVIVAFAIHFVIIFSGRLAEEAKGFVLFQARVRRLNRQVQALDAEFGDAAQLVVNRFNRYYQDLHSYNQQNPGRVMPAAEFDAITRALVNELFGREVIQTPAPAAIGRDRQAATDRSQETQGNGARSSYSPPPPAPEPVSPNGHAPREVDNDDAGGADGETEYLRRILSGRVRDADEEM
jgi:hypothetical protein